MRNIKEELGRFINDRRVLILGFGKEGRSTYHILRSYFPKLEICISDLNTDISKEKELEDDSFLSWVLGEGHMKALSHYDLVFKSPGISFKDYQVPTAQQISSQTDLFIELFHEQIIGITGTKGKSTTVSLIHHLLKADGKKVLLVGNIGTPALDILSQINDDTYIVYELSSHQLEFITHSPHIAVFLNLYEEHLDHYVSYLAYQQAKANITVFQESKDFLIYNRDDILVNKRIKESGSEAQQLPFCKIAKAKCTSLSNQIVQLYDGREFTIDLSKVSLLGKHNQLNILAALNVIAALDSDVKKAIEHIYSFKSLPHRLEDVGIYNEIHFVNDSIATIPEATIMATETFDNLDTLILGGYNRGIDYSILIDYLMERNVPNIILLGEVGCLIRELLEEENYKFPLFYAIDMDDVVNIAMSKTKAGGICLLSPAASSYDIFHNFEDRGDQYKKKVREYSR
jgi:UDP-N-acetylmuramoylalanine--D-glutamate ligase